MKKVVIAGVTLIMSVFAAFGQANLTFSGGNGSPFSLTLVQPIVFTITTAAPASPFFSLFVFDGLGVVFQGTSGGGLTTNITFTVNGGSPRLLEFCDSGVNTGAVTPDDLEVFNRSSTPAFNVGDIVILNAGSLTAPVIAGPPPANGPYNAFLARGFDRTRISTFAVSIPEPSGFALMLVGAAGLGVFSRYRARR